MSTVSWAAWIALRVRVGSLRSGLCLRSKGISVGSAGDYQEDFVIPGQAVVGHLAQADPAEAELAETARARPQRRNRCTPRS